MTGNWGPEVDLRTDRPTPARMYDYYLGGKDNYPVDRAAAEQVMRIAGADLVRTAALENRAFLRRTVRYLAGAGVRQFLDLGAGLPTRGNVHEVAREVTPDATVVYVDDDPIVLAHGRALLAEDRSTTVVTADMTDVDGVLAAARATGLLDPSRPVAVLLYAVLHFVTDDDEAARVVARYREALPGGGYVVASHASPEDERHAEEVGEVYRGATASLRLRRRDEVAALLAGLDLVDPGLVRPATWRPDGPDGPSSGSGWGAVGRF